MPIKIRRPRPQSAGPMMAAILAASALGAGPADELLRITPAHSAATLVVESLRDQSRAIRASPLFEALRRSLAMQRGPISSQLRRLGEFARQIEASFDSPIATIRDQVLGEAAVLAFFPGPATSPQDSRGLLMTRGHDRAVVEKIFASINGAQLKNGDLLRIEPRTRGTITYAARIFRPGLRLYEFYAQLDGSTFIWTNSESLIRKVIDLKLSGDPGLADIEAFDRARRGLPANALASLFVGPEMIRRIRDESRPASDRVGRLIHLIAGRYADAVGFEGLGFVWDGGPAIHQHEALLPGALDPSIRSWLGGPAAPVDPSAQVPSSALAVASIELDLPAIRRMILGDVESADLNRFALIREFLRGTLSGLDPVEDVLPRLGRTFLAYIDSQPGPDRWPPFPIVGILGWSEAAGLPGLGTPIDHALRACLALRAIGLADGANVNNLRVEPLVEGRAKMTSLTNGRRELVAYRIDGDRLIIGNSSEALRRPGASALASPLREIRARHFGDARSFAILDLDRSGQGIRKFRGPIARRLAAGSNRPIAEVDGDLDEVLGVADLFRAAGFASEVRAEGSEVHRRLLLIPR